VQLPFKIKLNENLKLSTYLNNSKVLFFSLLLLHLFSRIFYLDQIEFSGDDAFSVFYAQQSISELLDVLNKEANPPFYFILLHFWIKLFGVSVFAIKSLQILISFISVVLIIKITQKLGGFIFSFFIGSAFIFSNLQLHLNYELRATALVICLTLLSYYLLLKIVETNKTKHYLLWILITLSLPYSHYNAVLVPLVQFISLPFFYRSVNKKILYKLILGFLFSAILFIPQLLIFSKVIPDENFWLGLATWEEFKFIIFKVIGMDSCSESLLLIYLVSPILMLYATRKNYLAPSFSNVRFSGCFGYYSLFHFY
jgi:4-amino-4-deoxy-L-arabinose transferase-like glycosyltransferase